MLYSITKNRILRNIFSWHKLSYEVYNFWNQFCNGGCYGHLLGTMTFQYGGYFAFKLIVLDNGVGDPIFYFMKHFSIVFSKFKKFGNGNKFLEKHMMFF